MKYAPFLYGAGLLMIAGCATPERNSANSSFDYRPFLAGRSFVGRWEGKDILDGGRFIGQFNEDGSTCEGFIHSVTWDRYGRFQGTLAEDKLTQTINHAVKYDGKSLVVTGTGQLTGSGEELQCSPVFTYPDGQQNHCVLVCEPIAVGTKPTYENLRTHENRSAVTALAGYPHGKSLPRLPISH